jgi:hypothetical protein
MRKAYRQYAVPDLPDTEEPVFIGTVDRIFRYNTLRVCERVSCQMKPDAVFLLVLPLLFVIPFKSCHKSKLP